MIKLSKFILIKVKSIILKCTGFFFQEKMCVNECSSPMLLPDVMLHV